MSDMKCPFCNRNLHKGEDGIYSHLDYMTECKGRLFDGSKELWQELIRTRKALDVAVDGLLAVWRATGRTTKQGSIAYNVLRDLNIKPLDRITALDQKDK